MSEIRLCTEVLDLYAKYARYAYMWVEMANSGYLRGKGRMVKGEGVFFLSGIVCRQKSRLKVKEGCIFEMFLFH